jgi:hypothetical protein
VAVGKANLKGLNPVLDSALKTVGRKRGKALEVMSASRSQEYQDNLRLNGGDPERASTAKVSQHTPKEDGLVTAVDINTKGWTDQQKAELVDSLLETGAGLGIGVYADHIHFDTRQTAPKTLNLDKGWGGWTTLPPAVAEVMRKRGVSASVGIAAIDRGPSAPVLAEGPNKPRPTA